MMLVSKIISHSDNPDCYIEMILDLEKPFESPFVMGEMKSLFPGDFDVLDKKIKIIKQSLFNSSQLTRIVVPVSPKGKYLLILRPNHILEQIHVEPDDVIFDLNFGEHSLIYSFYNPTRRESIVIWGKLAEDTEGVYNKIKANPTDITWRQYFIRRAIIKPGTSPVNLPVEFYPELMTAAQVAKYLQVEIKTIRNWTSQGVIPTLKVGKTVRYSKTEIDKGNFQKKKTKAKQKN